MVVMMTRDGHRPLLPPPPLPPRTPVTPGLIGTEVDRLCTERNEFGSCSDYRSDYIYTHKKSIKPVRRRATTKAIHLQRFVPGSHRWTFLMPSRLSDISRRTMGDTRPAGALGNSPEDTSQVTPGPRRLPIQTTPCPQRTTIQSTSRSLTPYTRARKIESFERINSIRETNENFDSCN